MERKYKLNVRFGGIYSNVMIGLQYMGWRGFSVESCYLNVDALELNPLDYVLDQKLAAEYETIQAQSMATFHHRNRVDKSGQYPTLKQLATTLRYKQELLDLVDRYIEKFNIDSKTVGVHVRLCDMNILHSDLYGYVTYGDYVREIQKHIDSDSTLFIASDNEESVEKLQRDFNCKVNYVPGMIRGSTESENTYDLQLNNFTRKELWVEAFLDMLLLSKCSKLICRTSNLANMSIISSNTINKIIMI